MTWRHRYAVLVSACTLVLVAAGGLVTSTGSGLSVPDWPTTYGYNMFTFPVRSWVGGILYEHGHRLIASTVGLLTIGLAVWLWRDPRRWLRWLGVAAVAAVTLQGLLGGLTVLYFLPASVSIAHAGLAQLFFALTVAIAVFTSRAWQESVDPPVADPRLLRLALATTVVVYGQILLGATVRHTGAGLAIPDFPLAFGRWLPPVWSVPVALHFAHRVGAVVTVAAVLATTAHVVARHGQRPALVQPAWLLAVLVLVQFTLGAFVVLTGRQVAVNTAHVAVGALLFGTSVWLLLHAARARFEGARAARVRPFRAAQVEAEVS
jgi:cytochrome c oxidase assembly protein subunit 15